MSGRVRIHTSLPVHLGFCETLRGGGWEVCIGGLEGALVVTSEEVRCPQTMQTVR